MSEFRPDQVSDASSIVPLPSHIYLRGLHRDLPTIGYSPGELQHDSDPVSRQYRKRRQRKNKAAKRARRRNSRLF